MDFIENKACRIVVIRVTDGLFINYSYIVIDKKTKKCAIIDPAWQIDVYSDFINKQELVPVYVLLTHYHWDHTNLAREVSNLYSCLIAISKQEMLYDFSGILRLYHNQMLYIGDLQVTCLSTPGHTQGSMCYLLDSFLFSGDTVFIEGVGMCKEYENGVKELYESIQLLKRKIKDHILLLPGHKYEYEFDKTFKDIKHLNIYFHFDSIEEFVKFRLRKRQDRLLDFK